MGGRTAAAILKNNRASSVLLTIFSVAVAISAIAWLFSYGVTHAQTYEIAGTPTGILPIVQFTTVQPQNPVYLQAMLLFREWGTRPYWNAPQLIPGGKTDLLTADSAIEHLIPCESAGNDVNTIDSNATTSYGILQIQAVTWAGWSKASGITGDPDDNDDAIIMAEWAIMNGHIAAWTCARILHVVAN
jgi:hypothetical protein